MQRTLLSVLGLFVLAVPASAHFPWIVPSADGTKALVVFSDTLEPDKNVPITKLKALKVSAWKTVGKGATGIGVILEKKEHAYEATMPAGLPFLSGTCKYGVVAKGKGDPYLLIYYPKAIVEAKPGPIPVGSGLTSPGLEEFFIDLMPTRGAGKPHVAGFHVYFQNKPLADAEIVIMVPGADKEIDGKTDNKGYFSFHVDHHKFPGLYGVRARHVEKKEGKEGDKEYKEIRHYTTLVFRVAAEAKTGDKETKQTKLPANPEATKLLADARAARATWSNFPGFTAALTVNLDGVVHKGLVEVSDEGKVKVTLADKDANKWVTGQLRSVVSHRLDNSADRNTPCAFADTAVHHPLGRKILVLNDELHSSYRIRGKEIVEVNRQMGAGGFTITVLQSMINAEKKLLSTCYVVNTRPGLVGAFSSQAFHQTWVRVGGFDLPAQETIIEAGVNGIGGLELGMPFQSAKTVTLTNHKLLTKTAPK